METKTVNVPFSIEAFVSNEETPVFTANGTPVRILCTDADCGGGRTDDIIALVGKEGSGKNVMRYYSNGHAISDSNNRGNFDLVFHEEVVVDEDNDDDSDPTFRDVLYWAMMDFTKNDDKDLVELWLDKHEEGLFNYAIGSFLEYLSKVYHLNIIFPEEGGIRLEVEGEPVTCPFNQDCMEDGCQNA